MPDGYLCDRCTDFTEQAQTRDGPNGRPRDVRVHGSSDTPGNPLCEFTLCEDCRNELIDWVECYT